MYRTQRHRRTANNDGFTLIEIVVALAILGTALVILLECQYGAMRLYDDARYELEMDKFLQLAVGIAETEVLSGNRSGGDKFSRRYKDYTYKFSASDVDATRLPGLYEVEIEVTSPTKDTREAVVLVFDPVQPE